MNMNNNQLIAWALEYFSRIPDKYRLPSDKRLLNEAVQVEVYNKEMSEDLKKELIWLYQLLEGDFLSIANRKNRNKGE
jgi:hypothetical protein